jgi:hypothetical protein
MRIDYELGALAAQQAGYLGRNQVLAQGVSEAAIRWRLDSGTWVLVRNGLYKVVGVDGDYQGRLRGAMATLPDPTISHESAAEIHGIPYVARGKATVTVHASTTHGFPDVTVHRSIDLLPHHRLKIAGQSVTTPERTLIDVAAKIRLGALGLALDESLASGLVSITEVQKLFEEVARRGRTGSGPMRKLLNERLGSDVVPASRLERLGMSVFERGGLPPPQWQYPAPWDPAKRIDFAWPHVCVGCECDSRRWHSRVSDFQRDRERDNLSLAHNWKIFRFTWEDFTKRPDVVISQLAGAIAV